ncbi:carbonic anhydrase [Kangiella sp. HZ709]|uniref:carbonic anhydrase n=1 Tax=Kangiella sp. HZ709 TaxID=2666328 RepID=UPI0012B0845B|nr:carbonic anhydrase [Kangiella sp. HZ709]MRX28086.1 carbonic anhydrase [Kangiella sp. HZ709]
MISSQEALAKLKQGNQRFVDCQFKATEQIDQSSRSAKAASQAPFAIILGCADSRTPAELIFDQGLGELFVVRVAGNIAAASQIGSIEYAVESFGTPLVVVMGHTNCGAVNATVDFMAKGDVPFESDSLTALVKRIAPSVQPLLKNDNSNHAEVKQLGVSANVKTSMQDLVNESPVLQKAIEDERLQIVGAEYSLETGEVKFL